MADTSTERRIFKKWQMTVHGETRSYSMSFGYMDGEATAAVWDDAQPERMVFIPTEVLVLAQQAGWIPQSA